jgi:hypothetical protein
MRIAAIASPRKVATIPKLYTLHMRVIGAGGVLLAREEQTLISGGGLPVSSTDGLVSLVWDAGEVWVQGDPTGTMEIVLP